MSLRSHARLFACAAALLCTTSLWSATTYDDGRPMLGVQMNPTPIRVQQANGLTPGQGVHISRVYAGSAAENLGVKRGDVIIAIDGRGIDGMSGLRDIISSTAVGQEVAVSVMRGGERLDLGSTALRQWPESIPFTPIDVDAERRYNDMQLRQLARNQDAIDAVRRRVSEAENELANLPENSTGGPAANSARPGPAGVPASQALAPTAGGSQAPRLIPAALLALPEWSFAWELDVADPQAGSTAWQPAVAASTTAPLPLDLSYSLSVDADAL